jgi:UDP:flavonoid glycosyltransferase YjiC (YdhE family)
MTKKLNILFVSMDTFGHVLSCVGFAETLRNRGHRITFAIDKSWKGKLNEHGFEEELYSISNRKDSEKPSEYWVTVAYDLKHNFRLSPLSQWKGCGVLCYLDMLRQAKEIDAIASTIVGRNKPDVIVINSLVCLPSLITCGIPWVNLVSVNPLMFFLDSQLPPATMGNAFNCKVKS